MKGERQNFILRAFAYGRNAYGVLAEHKFTTIAGTLVFFLVMSLVPFLFWLTLLFGKLGVDLTEIFSLELFGWAQDLTNFLQESAQGATAGASILFLATTLWSSTGFFYHLRRSGEVVYGYSAKKHGWKVRLSAFFITFCLLLFFAVAGGTLFGAVLFSRYLSPYIAYPAVYALILAFGFFGAWSLNSYACPYRVRPADTVAGSAITALLWLFASAVFSVYLRFSSAEKLYGALSLVIIFLLWLYWMMICFTVGFIFNRHRLQDNELAHKRY